ncbi:hypothetical protein OCS_02802 [Ophiocordyceps sinensis CO18]|uniref:Uncharacterized protein n=1 Tax=Ophiocordyceps sinensis (strain Co18 / CGMCC 3.14243) TaxID=911162 RepID=T5AGD5_OPHSC|nr:hypothetical protein OCS_02802 [Ophiocordyceps sinensis CO18]
MDRLKPLLDQSRQQRQRRGSVGESDMRDDDIGEGDLKDDDIGEGDLRDDDLGKNDTKKDDPGETDMRTDDLRAMLAAIRALVPTLRPERPLFAALHDGLVHHPLGGAAYAFEKDLVGPLLSALAMDEEPPTVSRASSVQRRLVLCGHADYAFLLARDLSRRIQSLGPRRGALPAVVVEISIVDTAPVAGEAVEVDGLHYQRSYRDVPAALEAHMDDYVEVLRQMSAWSEIPFRITRQADFSDPSMASLVSYAVEHRARLASQLSPKHNALAIRAACPVSGCALAEKHSRLNRYPAGHIHFTCPRHGQHSVSLSDPQQVARLEANAPARNLLRSMLHLVDRHAHHVRITGSDYAGTYQEALLLRPLAQWSAATGLAVGRTPHILYAPLVVDWSGAKLSKGLYVRQGGYDAMEMLGTDGLHSFARLKSKHGPDGLRRIWTEVETWLAEPHKLFRASVSVEYLQGLLDGRPWQ